MRLARTLLALRLDAAGRRSLYNFNGHTDVKELALYLEDSITKGNWALEPWACAATSTTA